MAKSDPNALSNAIASTRRELNNQLNNLIDTILDEKKGLPEASPQYSGFFASSWQVNTYRPLANQEIRSPWSEVKKLKDKSSNNKYLPAIVNPRYSRTKRYKFGETIFIGNRANYARYALGSSNSQIMPYLENITQVVDAVFSGSMLYPNIKVAGTQVLPEGVKGGRTAPASGSRYIKL